MALSSFKINKQQTKMLTKKYEDTGSNITDKGFKIEKKVKQLSIILTFINSVLFQNNYVKMNTAMKLKIN